VAWQWQRGPNKRNWIRQILKTYLRTTHSDAQSQDGIDLDMVKLQEKTTLTSLDWFVVLGLTILLLGVPYTLAFLTAFYTPEIGVSCIALTITISASVQFAHILLWLWAYAGPPAKPKNSSALVSFFCKDGWLDKSGFYDPTSIKSFMGDSPKFTVSALMKGVQSREFRSVSSLWCVIWYFLYAELCAIAVVAALGGTIMQLIGVYSADVCQVTVPSWFQPFDLRPAVVLSVNSPLMIELAVST
jgi:hypothetical protein